VTAATAGRRAEFCLPADEGALVRAGLLAGRDAEYRDRNDLSADDTADAEAPAPGARAVSWADGLVRLASEGLDALDPEFRRTGDRGERSLVVLHFDVDPDGALEPGQLDLGPVIPDPVARYLACDAKVQAVTSQAGRLIGIHPTERTVNRPMRRYLNRRDQGCTHPLCGQTRWLHAHHIRFWTDHGLTAAENLVLLCPFHHRALHLGEFRIDGDPEAGTLRFLDRWDNPITPPSPDRPRAGPPPGSSPHGDPPPPRIFDPPLGERLTPDTVAWN
jgi:hypothetical protein